MVLSEHFKRSNFAQKNFELHAWVKGYRFKKCHFGLGLISNLPTSIPYCNFVEISQSYIPIFVHQPFHEKSLITKLTNQQYKIQTIKMI